MSLYDSCYLDIFNVFDNYQFKISGEWLDMIRVEHRDDNHLNVKKEECGYEVTIGPITAECPASTGICSKSSTGII
eukprot:8282910-Prorocentrum_lima.AAC.1